MTHHTHTHSMPHAAPCGMRHAPSRTRHQASCLMPHASCLASSAACLLPRASGLVPRASGLGPRASCLKAHALCLAPRASRLTPRASYLVPRTAHHASHTTELRRSSARGGGADGGGSDGSGQPSARRARAGFDGHWPTASPALEPSLTQPRLTPHASPLTARRSPFTTYHPPLSTHYSTLTTRPHSRHASRPTPHASRLTPHASPRTPHRSPLTAHHSPPTARHSTLDTQHSTLTPRASRPTAHRSRLTTHHAPLTPHHLRLTPRASCSPSSPLSSPLQVCNRSAAQRGPSWVGSTASAGSRASSFERHPHPAGGEGNASGEVAPSRLSQRQVAEPVSACTLPGPHGTQGQGLLERALVWSTFERSACTRQAPIWCWRFQHRQGSLRSTHATGSTCSIHSGCTRLLAYSPPAP